MFGELAAWLVSKSKEERREHVRSGSSFKIAYSMDGATWHPAIGLDISPAGVSLLAQHGFPKKEVDARITIETRIVPCRLEVVRAEQVMYQGRGVYKYGTRFTAMRAEDSEAVLRWLKGGPLDQTNKAKQELDAVRLNPDDVARLFPKALQDRLHDELVKRNRLAPPKPNMTPLVAYFYGGLANVRGKKMHRLTIESKVTLDHDEMRYRTRFMFDETGNEIAIVE